MDRHLSCSCKNKYFFGTKKKHSMKWLSTFLVSLVLLTSFQGTASQASDPHSRNLQNNIDRFKAAGMYADAIKTVVSAREYALMKALAYQWSDLGVQLIELHRLIGDPEKGLAVGYGFSSPENPEIEVKRLGRMAACHNEIPSYSQETRTDSTAYYIKKALIIANKFQFKKEKASLYNEWATLVFRTGNHHKIDWVIDKYKEAISIYRDLDEKEDYGNCLNHLLSIYILQRKKEEAESIKKLIIELLKQEENTETRGSFYNNLALEAGQNKDSLNEYRYSYLSSMESLKIYQNKNSNELQSYKALYETEQYKAQLAQNEADKRKAELQLNQSRITTWIIIGVIIFITFLLIVVVQFLKKEKLQSKKLNEVNQELTDRNNKYQLLHTESNHRIKNNLAMIKSFLSLTANSLEGNEKQVITKIVDKLEVLSKLHNHLTFEEHNPSIAVDEYLTEITNYYASMYDLTNFQVEIDHFAMPSERIIYLGLIVAELLSNTIEHRGRNQEEIILSMENKTDEIVFIYTDRSQFDETQNEKLGITFIREILSRLNAFDLRINKNNGTYMFTITQNHVK